MALHSNAMSLYQELVTFLVTVISMVLVAVLALFYLLKSRNSKRPGINLKEL